MTDDDPLSNGGDGRSGPSVTERRGGEGDEQQGDLFPMGILDGDQKTLATLFKKGLPTTVTVSMGTAEVPMRDGLPDPDRLARLAVTCEVANYVPIPQREERQGERKIVGLKVRANLRPVHVEQLRSGEDEVQGAYALLLSEDPNAAATLLDRLSAMTAEALAEPAATA